MQIENRRWLRLDNYVGILQLPSGTLLEILPKHYSDSDETVENSRKLLIKMLTVALDLPQRTTDKTDVQTFRHPLLEWVMKQYVTALDYLVKRGVRFDYQRVEEEQYFLRGQLDVNKQLRKAPGRAHIFNIRHDLFLADRAENRLLKSALMRICRITQQPDTWRLSHELAEILSEIPTSKDIQSDFRAWRTDRFMSHYQSVRPWCELVLGQSMPLALRGNTQGISMLFPMEKLFERYVEVQLRKVLLLQYTLKAQAASKYLCTHNDGEMFQLRPDLLIQERGINRIVLDTKWKLISENSAENKYGLSQSDFYQLFAYGHKYLGDNGTMILIYPAHQNFTENLPKFKFSNSLSLWVVPFDLETDAARFPSEFLLPTAYFSVKH